MSDWSQYAYAVKQANFEGQKKGYAKVILVDYIGTVPSILFKVFCHKSFKTTK